MRSVQFLKSPVFVLGLAMSLALVVTALLLWRGGDERHALGTLPLALLLVVPLVLLATRSRYRGGRRRGSRRVETFQHRPLPRT